MRFTYFRSEPRRRHARSPRSSASRGGSAPSARQGPVRSQKRLAATPPRFGTFTPVRCSDVPQSLSGRASPDLGRTLRPRGTQRLAHVVEAQGPSRAVWALAPRLDDCRPDARETPSVAPVLWRMEPPALGWPPKFAPKKEQNVEPLRRAGRC